MTIFTELLTIAKIITNFDDAVVLVNNTVKTTDVTVPGNKRWFYYGGYMTNGDDVARDCQCAIYDGTDLLYYIRVFAALGAGAVAAFPNTSASAYNIRFPSDGLALEPGWIIRFTWNAGGASTGGNSTISAMVREVDV